LSVGPLKRTRSRAEYDRAPRARSTSSGDGSDAVAHPIARKATAHSSQGLRGLLLGGIQGRLGLVDLALHLAAVQLVPVVLALQRLLPELQRLVDVAAARQNVPHVVEDHGVVPLLLERLA